VSADQPVHDVAELMEQRANLVVRHQSWIVGSPARETGDEHGLRYMFALRTLAHDAGEPV